MPYNTATANYGSFSTSSSAYPTDDVINNAVEFIKGMFTSLRVFIFSPQNFLDLTNPSPFLHHAILIL